MRSDIDSGDGDETSFTCYPDQSLLLEFAQAYGDHITRLEIHVE